MSVGRDQVGLRPRPRQLTSHEHESANAETDKQEDDPGLDEPSDVLVHAARLILDAQLSARPNRASPGDAGYRHEDRRPYEGKEPESQDSENERQDRHRNLLRVSFDIPTRTQCPIPTE